MALIRRTPPAPPTWELHIDEDERQYLLAALDMAITYIKETRHWDIMAVRWPLPKEHYAQMLGFLEQLVASVNQDELRNA